MKPLIDSEKLASELSLLIFLLGLGLVISTTLFPFVFDFREGFSTPILLGNTDFRDILNNILLFVLFGFGLTGLIDRSRVRKKIVFMLVISASASLSCFVEILQIFIPARYPTIADVITNSIGGWVGFVSYQRWKENISGYDFTWLFTIKNWLSVKSLTSIFILYFLLTVLLSILPLRPKVLGNWDISFPLLLGNEQTGDRPWEGFISDLYMTDKALAKDDILKLFSVTDPTPLIKESLIADYQFPDRSNRANQIEQFPSLSWRGKPPHMEDKTGVHLSKGAWLTTIKPAESLINKLRKSSQFTLNITFTTDIEKQSGPARIVSLSGDTQNRNFTLGQSGADLIFRLRTVFTGENGDPEISIFNVFTEGHTHHVIITFDGVELLIYLDRINNLYTFDLIPEINFFRLIGHSIVKLNIISMKSYKFLYYIIIFMPLGLLLGLISRMSAGRLQLKILSICGGLLLPTFVLETMLLSRSIRPISYSNLVLSIGIMLLAIAFVDFKRIRN